ncbi:MAG TPA: hypothetical protein DIT66_08570 [Rhodobiaceae bacterium]|jgi:hypothetical protein|nr:hypothetical protein [Rhodobiaceae bacterium]|tara:strand:+ start:142 stop:831 length:690 start_codon:yes stop_codon:yes gene_type:complete
MKKLLLGLLICVPPVFAGLFWLAFFSARPPLATDPATLAGDGSTLDYCALPALDGSGKNAVDIAKGNTPGCAYTHFPLPVLAQCTEPLHAEADDIRGLWRGVAGTHIGHVERIEQCGSRTVVTAAGIIHDYGPNATGGLNTNDTEGNVMFTLGGREYCPRTSASMIWEDGILNFYAFGWGPKAVRRYRDGDQLVWEYIDGSQTRMERICTLPAEHKTPRPRGRRIALFD